MTNFTLEKYDDEGKKCTFYTVRWTGSEKSETERFFRKYGKDIRYQEAIKALTTLIFEVIADDHGALEDHFRFENYAHALPTGKKNLLGKISLNLSDFPLRIYCLRMSDSLVVLFNGGEKTSQSAQSGKTSMVFSEANLFAERIMKAIMKKEIYIDDDSREFRNSDGSDEIVL